MKGLQAKRLRTTHGALWTCHSRIFSQRETVNIETCAFMSHPSKGGDACIRFQQTNSYTFGLTH